MKTLTEQEQTYLLNISNASNMFLPFTLVSAASNNATVVKDYMGTIGNITAINVTTTVHFIKFYNQGTTPNPATDVPVAVFPIPADTSGAGLTLSITPGLRFSKGISFVIVKGIASNDNTAADANAVVLTLAYK